MMMAERASPILVQVRLLHSATPSCCALIKRTLMTARRLSKLQRQILQTMWTQYERTQGGISTGHLELVQALRRDKSNVSHSLRTLEA